MSKQVKTFFPAKVKVGTKETDWVCEMIQCPGDCGEYVLESDYAALAAELERMRSEHEVGFSSVVLKKWAADYAALAAENDRLRAEVEWIRKADRLVCWNPATQEWEVRHESPK